MRTLEIFLPGLILVGKSWVEGGEHIFGLAEEVLGLLLLLQVDISLVDGHVGDDEGLVEVGEK